MMVYIGIEDDWSRLALGTLVIADLASLSLPTLR